MAGKWDAARRGGVVPASGQVARPVVNWLALRPQGGKGMCGRLRGGACGAELSLRGKPLPTVTGNMARRMLEWRVSAVVVARVAAGAAWIGVIGLVDFFLVFFLPASGPTEVC